MISGDVLTLLSAGGDLATIAFLLLLWRLDRRLIVIETTLQHVPKREDDFSRGAAS